MHKKDFIERLKFPHRLDDDKISLWQDLKNKYPYSALIQQIFFQKNRNKSEATLKNISLYKNDPILFSNLLKNTKEVENEIEKNIPDEPILESTEINSVIDNEHIDVLNNSIIEVEEATSEEETIFEEETRTEEETLSLEEKEAAISEENNIDILEEIDVLEDKNELVENIKVNLEVQALNIEKNDLTVFDKNADQDKSLMVMLSFTDWLQHFKHQNLSEIDEEMDKKKLRVMLQRQKLDTAMDTDNDDVPEDIFKLAMESISFGPSIISESLANILAKQGKIDKAVDMFKKLSLLNPEKNAYFASKIKDLHLNN